MTYPYIRLLLECGCCEVQTGPGAADSYSCAGDALAGQDHLILARHAVLKHGILTVADGGGCVDLEGKAAPYEADLACRTAYRRGYGRGSRDSPADAGRAESPRRDD